MVKTACPLLVFMETNITPSTLLKQEHTALAAEITDIVKANLPREKSIAARQMQQTASEVKQGLAPTSGDGRGQALLSVPPIIYMRWQQEYPGCWNDEQFCAEFAYDNPQCCLPGYKPRAKRRFFDMKHGNLKLNNVGGDLYWDRKFKVLAAVQAQTTGI